MFRVFCLGFRGSGFLSRPGFTSELKAHVPRKYKQVQTLVLKLPRLNPFKFKAERTAHGKFVL